jgi:acyl carrier protein
MNDVRERLIACFTSVFPSLTAESATTANVDAVASWDSGHHFILIQVIEEAFDIRFPETVLGEIDSFQGFEQYLAMQQKASPSQATA